MQSFKEELKIVAACAGCAVRSVIYVIFHPLPFKVLLIPRLISFLSCALDTTS